MSPLNWPFRPKPQPEPDDMDTQPSPKWLQAWVLFRKIPVEKLFPAVTLTSFVVFLAISGFVAWAVVFLSFIVQLFRVLL